MMDWDGISIGDPSLDYQTCCLNLKDCFTSLRIGREKTTASRLKVQKLTGAIIEVHKFIFGKFENFGCFARTCISERTMNSRGPLDDGFASTACFPTCAMRKILGII